MRITSDGDVCIASTSPVSTRRELRIGGNAAGSRISLGLNGTNYSALVTDSGGNVYLAQEYNDSAIKLLMINYNNGVYLSQSATSWTANSDERLKDINGTIDNAVDKLNTLRAVNFTWKSDTNKKEVLGLIAQDVAKVFPQVIDKNKIVNQNESIKDNTEYLGVRYTELVPVLVKAIQEQQTQINELKSQLNK
jgi:lipopolysaccharide export LptBFGC system permease protein LptF